MTEEEELLVDEALGDHAYLVAVVDSLRKHAFMEVVHDRAHLLEEPVEDSETGLVPLALVQQSVVVEGVLEDLAPVFLLQLLQSLELLHSVPLPDEND